jgi:hypothetical protein
VWLEAATARSGVGFAFRGCAAGEFGHAEFFGGRACSAAERLSVRLVVVGEKVAEGEPRPRRPRLVAKRVVVGDRGFEVRRGVRAPAQ